MSINENVFTPEELVEFKLRNLFMKNGYKRYNMSRFEEYDLYAHNKDFITDNRIITFTDEDGRLLALKPDVTMSVVRHLRTKKDIDERIFYAENIYRYSKKSKGFHEIRQVGVERLCSKALDTAEIALLAARGLAEINGEFILNVSHLGFITGLLKRSGVSEELFATALKHVADKNVSALRLFAKENSADFEMLNKLITVFGQIDGVLPEIKELCCSDDMNFAAEELTAIGESAKKLGFEKQIVVDFSLTNNVAYYDGLLLKGFINGLSDAVLSGGSYSKFATRLGVSAQAIGFVFYLNELEYLK